MDTAVVIVDNEADVIEALQALLEMDGYTVYAALTAEEGLQLVERHRPVGVILDLGMPVIDGIELTRRLRAQHGEDLPIIALTGWSEQEDRERAEQAGVDYVLVKPLFGEALRQIFPPIIPANPDT